MLAEKGAIIEKIEIQKIKDMAFILVDKEKIQRVAHTVTFQDIMRLTTEKNILKSC